MKLFELKNHSISASSDTHTLEHEGYKLRQEVNYDYGDKGRKENAKISHFVAAPEKDEELIDHNPYENMSADALKAYSSFHKKHGRFPSRKDTDSIGPLNNETVAKLS